MQAFRSMFAHAPELIRRLVLEPDAVFRHPSWWSEVSRSEALAVWQRVPVVVVWSSYGAERAAWFNGSSPFLNGVGPYNLRALRYYRFKEALPVPVVEARGSSAQQPAPAEPAPPVPAPPARARPKTWVAIELVDEDGNPIAGEKYRVELPDGSVAEGALDAQGHARFDAIDPGSCKVSFPDIHATEWA